MVPYGGENFSSRKKIWEKEQLKSTIIAFSLLLFIKTIYSYCTFVQTFDMLNSMIKITVGAMKCCRDLPLFEIGVLLKIGGTGSYYACLLHHLNILSRR